MIKPKGQINIRVCVSSVDHVYLSFGFGNDFETFNCFLLTPKSSSFNKSDPNQLVETNWKEKKEKGTELVKEGAYHPISSFVVPLWKKSPTFIMPSTLVAFATLPIKLLSFRN